MRRLTVWGIALALLVHAPAGATPAEDLKNGLVQGKSALVMQAIENGADPDALIAIGSHETRVLPWAARFGNLALVRRLLAKGADPNLSSPVDNFATALIIAADKGHVEVIIELLNKGARLDQTRYDGESALSLACRAGRTEIAALLLTNGKAQLEPGQLAKAADSAAAGGQVKILELLASNGVDLKPALHAAVAGHRLEVVKWLLQRGADPNQRDSEGFVPLQSLVQGYLERPHPTEPIIEVLLANGANPDALPLEELLELDAQTRALPPKLVERRLAAEKVNGPLLRMAIRGNSLATVRYLLARGHSPLQMDEQGEPIFFGLAEQGVYSLFKKGDQSSVTAKFEKERILAMAEAVMAKVPLNTTDKAGRSLLHRLFDAGPLNYLPEKDMDDSMQYGANLILADWLVKKGADVKIRTRKSVSVLDEALGLLSGVISYWEADAGEGPAYLGPPAFALCQSLLARGVSPDFKHEDIDALISGGILDGTPAGQDLAGKLIRQGALRRKHEDDTAFYPLHTAISKGNQKMVELMLANGADINLRSSFKHTPVCLAVAKGQTDILSLLLKHKPDLTIRCGYGSGQTALELAQEIDSESLPLLQQASQKN